MEGCYYVYLLLFLSPRKNPHTKPYDISVTRKQFSLVSLGNLCSQPHCLIHNTHNRSL